MIFDLYQFAWQAFTSRLIARLQDARNVGRYCLLTVVTAILFVGISNNLFAQVSSAPILPTAPSPPTAPEIASDDSPQAEATKEDADDKSDEEKKELADQQTIEIPANWKRLGKREIWIDFKAKQVVVGGTICLNEGALEMFVCPGESKAHESVIAANALASEVHASMIALNVPPGQPCQWDPQYKPAHGPIIDIDILWMDEKTNQLIKRSAKSFIRDTHTEKAMTHDWVFGGSQIYVDPDTGERIYYADGGEMICLSNFSTAMMDLTIESSDSDEGRVFEAFTENIPPVGTKVYVVMTPGKRIGPDGKLEPEKKAEVAPVEPTQPETTEKAEPKP